MKQYQIAFYKGKSSAPTIYYREFANKKEANQWATHWLNDSSLYVRFTCIQIPKYIYLENV